MNTLQEMIDVMTAARDGKTIEYRYRNSGQWSGVCADPLWDWSRYDYRVKPEPPKPRELYVDMSKYNTVLGVYVAVPQKWEGQLTLFREVL